MFGAEGCAGARPADLPAGDPGGRFREVRSYPGHEEVAESLSDRADGWSCVIRLGRQRGDLVEDRRIAAGAGEVAGLELAVWASGSGSGKRHCEVRDGSDRAAAKQGIVGGMLEGAHIVVTWVPST